MITVGEGHRSAALAGKAWLERRFPNGFDLDVVDFTAEVGDEAFDRWHKRSWTSMLRRPWTAFLGQRAIDSVVPPSWSRLVQRWMIGRQARLAARWLEAHPYDLVVATHFFPAHAMAVARARHGCRIPYVVVNPDIRDAHVLWSVPGAEAYCVFSDGARDDLLRFGIDEEHVRTFAPLLRPAFQEPCPEAERGRLRDELGVPRDALLVLWSAGGEGVGGKLRETMDRLEASEREVFVIALCGRNEALRHELERAATEARHVHLQPFGYRDDVASLLCAADAFIGKAGPASTFEALVLGTPVVHAGFAGANEKAVSDYVVSEGFGVRIERADELAAWIAAAASDRAELDAMTRRIVAAGIGNGGAVWADWLATTFFGEVAEGARAER